jgi:hypothetical protein
VSGLFTTTRHEPGGHASHPGTATVNRQVSVWVKYCLLALMLPFALKVVWFALSFSGKYIRTSKTSQTDATAVQASLHVG